MSQSTPGDIRGDGKSRKNNHGEGGVHLDPPSALLGQAGKSKGKKGVPFSLMMSMRMSMTMKVPVRPIPALEEGGKKKRI